MKLTERYSYRLPQPTLTIREAVASVLDGYSDESGELETMRRGIRNNRQFLGELVELLHSKGTLDDNDVLMLLGDTFTKVKV